MAVTRVTVHHEGAGTPSDGASGADGGYTYRLGWTIWSRLRSVADSFATKYYNGESVDIMLSGDRTNIPVTDADIRRIGECVADARSRGEVVDHPDVFPHNESYNTACPGNKTMERFPMIVVVGQAFEPPAVDWAAIARLDAWRLRVHKKRLRLGNRGPDVQIMNDLLKARGYVRESGSAYGQVSRAAIHRFKQAAGIANTSGMWFGGSAADAILR